MLQFVLLNDEAGASQRFICSKVPFTIGRSASADLQVSAAGVWENHAQVTYEGTSGKLMISPVDEALLLVNGERTAGKILLPGDEIQVGAISLRVNLAPVVQKSVTARERFVWALLILVSILEIILILRIG